MWGCDTALYRTAEAMRIDLPARLAAGPRVIKRNRGNGGQGVWKVGRLAGPRNRPMIRVLDATKDASTAMSPDQRSAIGRKCCPANIHLLAKETVLGLEEPEVRGRPRQPHCIWLIARLFDHHPGRLQNWVCD
jgi:hypothetical protein